MAVSLHTFITGQPMRLRPVRKALKHCAQHKQSYHVWYTRAVDIANYCSLFRRERSLVAEPGMPNERLPRVTRAEEVVDLTHV
jgi:hypothetical protein